MSEHEHRPAGFRLRPEEAAELVHWAGAELAASWAEVGWILGVSSRTVRRWRAGGVRPSPVHALPLQHVTQLQLLLAETFRDDGAGMHRWLGRSLPDPAGNSPITAILRGGVDRVIEFLETYQAGAFL